MEISTVFFQQLRSTYPISRLREALCILLTGHIQNRMEVLGIDFHLDGAQGPVILVARHSYLGEPAQSNQETLETQVNPEHRSPCNGENSSSIQAASQVN